MERATQKAREEFTKKDWTVDIELDGNGHYTIRNADGTCYGDIDAQPIATVYDKNNARLIAAAPDLLAALKALTAVLATQGDELAQANIAYIPEWNDAEAAIKAAEGGDDAR